VPFAEKAAAVFERRALFAFRQIEILPIRNGLLCIWPQSLAQDTKLMVVDGYRHIAHCKIAYGAFEFRLIVERINPKLADVPWRVPNIFEAHQRYVLNKREVAVDVLNQSR
jgi:hypothetical protein